MRPQALAFPPGVLLQPAAAFADGELADKATGAVYVLAARDHGTAVLVSQVDEMDALKEAQALYRKAGYSEIVRFGGNHYAHHGFGKNL